MSSSSNDAARAERSRQNGKKSRGPITERGKKRSSQNATRHGLYAEETVIRGEDPDAFNELLGSFVDSIEPEDPTEEALVLSMASGEWKRRRYDRLEAELFERVALEAGDDEAGDRLSELVNVVAVYDEYRKEFTAIQHAQGRAIKLLTGGITSLLKWRKGERDGLRAVGAQASEPAPTSAAQSAASPANGSPEVGDQHLTRSPEDRAFANLRDGTNPSPPTPLPTGATQRGSAEPSPAERGEGGRTQQTNPAEPTTTRPPLPDWARPTGMPKVWVG